jgi:hypothetical protein
MAALLTRLAIRLAARAGGEFHYRPRREPDQEPASTLTLDGRPCRGGPIGLELTPDELERLERVPAPGELGSADE